jgi:hypothetical protein
MERLPLWRVIRIVMETVFFVLAGAHNSGITFPERFNRETEPMIEHDRVAVCLNFDAVKAERHHGAINHHCSDALLPKCGEDGKVLNHRITLLNLAHANTPRSLNIQLEPEEV